MNGIMGIGHQNLSSSAPTASNHTGSLASLEGTPDSSPPLLPVSPYVVHTSGHYQARCASKTFTARTEHRLQVHYPLPPFRYDSPEPEEFYRSASTYKVVPPKQPSPSRRFATVPVAASKRQASEHDTALEGPHDLSSLGPSRSMSAQTQRNSEDQTRAISKRPSTPYPHVPSTRRYATLPVTATQRRATQRDAKPQSHSASHHNATPQPFKTVPQRRSRMPFTAHCKPSSVQSEQSEAQPPQPAPIAERIFQRPTWLDRDDVSALMMRSGTPQEQQQECTNKKKKLLAWVKRKKWFSKREAKRD
ncbi:hypothetical protein ACEQ8H_006673 [Pleosporales sp. CAS-2024a]